MKYRWLRKLTCYFLGHPPRACCVVQRNAFRVIVRCSYCEGEWIER